MVFLFSSDKYLEVQFLEYMEVPLLILLGTSLLLSTVATPIYIPANNVQGFPFLPILSNIYMLSVW